MEKEEVEKIVNNARDAMEARIIHGDAISRQALCEFALNQKDKNVTPNDIMRFPSAQPHSNELSKTRKALEELDSRLCSLPKGISADGQDYVQLADVLETVHRILELPSVQPEIIRCKNCKHWRINYYQDVETCFEHRNVDGTEQATRPEDYCSWAKRKEDD